MPQNLVARLAVAPNRLIAWASNAWTRAALDPAAARRIAGLRYWDGPVS
ncbi:MAG: hypothetical protein QOE05_835 [Actinomycetota bacterium]|jgi:hypothetical protein|nr:hypothetical protein [Actinomycetota bacterium]